MADLPEDKFLYESIDGSMKESFGKAVINAAMSLEQTNPQPQTHSFLEYPSLRLSAFEEGTKSPLSGLISSTSSPSKKIVIGSGFVDPSPLSEQSTESPVSVLSTSASTTISPLPYFTTSTNLKIFLTSSSVLKSDAVSKEETVAMDTDNVKPLPLNLARYLSSCYVMYCRRDDGNREQLPELWLLCQDDDSSSSTVAIGCVPLEKEIMLYQVREGNKPLMISNYKTFSLKPDTFLPRALSLKKKPAKRDGPFLSHSIYHFGFDVDEDNESEPTTSHISLEFKWEASKSNFTPPPTSSSATLNISSTPGSLYSPILHVFKELQLLIYLTEIYSGKREWTDMETDTESIMSPSKSSLSSMASTFLSELSSGVKAADSTLVSPSALVSLFQARDDFDFVDQLWSFLKGVSDPIDLTNALSVVFMSILKGKTQPFLQPDKTSTLASLFRLSLLADTTEKREVSAAKLQALLTQEKSLKALIEIGIEKMEKDYLWYFLSNNFASKNEILQFFLPDTATLLDRVHMLSSLHCVLELTADMSNFFALPRNRVTSFVRSVISYYRDVPVTHFTTTPTFSVTFPPLSPEVKTFTGLASSIPPSRLSLEASSRSIVAISEPLLKFMYKSQSLEEDFEGNITAMYVYCADKELLSL
ncbi:PREDICTED: protein zwilch homolog [Amphimedon queenslandica]|uniref:Protein zwilch n=1 Tax=Amphimedon queenslandica TaxID=400682 RepID=A0A1X7V8G0_AMPQE|nr:PREDICTED: protein zwilch homolog [Amphimedon queenslandica]|eukprot:XP_011402807.2 PREDICTED: protein zwilch homolog [Amphimedon queenslandica]